MCSIWTWSFFTLLYIRCLVETFCCFIFLSILCLVCNVTFVITMIWTNYQWLFARLQYLQCISKGNAVVLHIAINIMTRPSSSKNTSVCLSVCPSVHLSVFLSATHFSLCFSHCIVIMSYYHWPKWCHCKRSRSEVKVKGQGTRGQSKFCPNFGHFRTLPPVFLNSQMATNDTQS